MRLPPVSDLDAVVLPNIFVDDNDFNEVFVLPIASHQAMSSIDFNIPLDVDSPKTMTDLANIPLEMISRFLYYHYVVTCCNLMHYEKPISLYIIKKPFYMISDTHTQSCFNQPDREDIDHDNDLIISISQMNLPFMPETSVSPKSLTQDDILLYDNNLGYIEQNQNILLEIPINATHNTENTQGNNKSRKRIRNPDTWKRIAEKKKRLAGEEYISQTGARKRAKSVQPVNCNCHYKCNEHIDLQKRQDILKQYLSLKDERAKWGFIANSVEKKSAKRIKPPINGVESKRQTTFVYSLSLSNKRVIVCKQFFLQTLDISSKKVRTALNKKQESGVVSEDKRGQNPAPNRIPEEKREVVRSHIKSVPVVSSHYCRKTTKRQYLPPGLSEKRLYSDYLEYCKDKDSNPVSFHFYKYIFTSEFNYGFHRPKKDQCDFCTQYHNKTEEEKIKTKEEYDLHIVRKIEAREQKAADKVRAKQDPKFSVFTMDMEKILLSPHVLVGQLYYKKKLKMYNFTIFNLKNKIAKNYMWHEAHGTKGASEVATCVYNFLKEQDERGIEEITIYSDTAAGQNRNSILSAMFVRFLNSSKNIKIINQKFMESGHSEMECDSVHSTIETRGNQIDVFVPEGWCTVARTAKTTPPPYEVKEMGYSDFLNFKDYSKKIFLNKNKTDSGETVRWLKIKWLQYCSNETIIRFKYQLSAEEFLKLDYNTVRSRVTRTRNNNNIIVVQNEVPQPLYKKKLLIEKSKLKDLQDMCKKGVIPSMYHDFYMNYLEAEDREEDEENDGD